MDPSVLVANLNDPRRDVRYGAGKALIAASAAEPDAVYPYFDKIAEKLAGKDAILRWNATRILANLCVADRERRIDGVLNRFLEPLKGPELIAAANVLQSLPSIAASRPDLAPALARAAIGVRKARFKTPECRLVVLGHALNVLREMLPRLDETSAVLELAKSQLRARRPQVRTAARALLSGPGPMQVPAAAAVP